MELPREFGRTVVTLGFATEQDISEARREQRRRARKERRHVYLAEVLLEKEILDEPKLARALLLAKGYREQGDDPAPRVGEIAIAKGYASPLQIWDSLDDQRHEVLAGGPRRLIGDILVETCRLTPWELEDVLITAAELAAGSLRTGATPADGFRVGEGALEPGRSDDAASYRRRDGHRARTLTAEPPRRALAARDVITRFFRTSPDARVGEALELAVEGDAEAILVFHEGELVGVLSIWDAKWMDPGLRVGSAMSRVEIVVDAKASLEEVAALLRERGLAFAPVTSGGDVEGVVGLAELRVAGVAIPPAENDLGGAG
jgi:CBS domain-containing protein